MKLEEFLKVMEEDVEKEINRIISEANKKAEEMVKKEEERINEIYSKKIETIRRELELEREQMLTEEKLILFNSLLTTRKKIVEKIYKKILNELKKFCNGKRKINGEDYRSYLEKGKKLIQENFKEFKVYSRKGDKIAAEIFYNLIESEEIKIGGIIAEDNEGNRIDLTFDSKLKCYDREIKQIITRELFFGEAKL